MSFKLHDTITTTFLDTVRHEVKLSFPSNYRVCDSIVVHLANNLTPFTYVDGELQTFEATISAYVTLEQNKYLEKLYEATMHPGYVDQRYPINLMWGVPESMYEASGTDGLSDYRTTKKCYLCNYVPPTNVDYSSSDILSVELSLREI